MVDVSTGSTGGSITVTGGSITPSVTATSDTTQYWSNQSKMYAEQSEASAKKSEQAKDEVIAQKDIVIGEVTAEGNKQKEILETTSQSYVDEAKNWANKLGDTVNGVEYSAKHYAELTADRAESAITNIQTQEDLSLSVINNKEQTVLSEIETGLTDINNAKTTSLNEITTSKDEVISAIQTEGATQVNNIKQTGFYMEDGKLYYNDNGEIKEFSGGEWGKIQGDITAQTDLQEQLALKTDKAQAAHVAMPSNRYIDFALGASGARYTAPADGYFAVGLRVMQGAEFQVTNITANYLSIAHRSGANDVMASGYVPARKGDVLALLYTKLSSNTDLNNLNNVRFHYAEGAN